MKPIEGVRWKPSIRKLWMDGVWAQSGWSPLAKRFSQVLEMTNMDFNLSKLFRIGVASMRAMRDRAISTVAL